MSLQVPLLKLTYIPLGTSRGMESLGALCRKKSEEVEKIRRNQSSKTNIFSLILSKEKRKIGTH
jgi:hypothetical protein